MDKTTELNKLRESESHYRLLFENMLSGVAYCKMLYDDKGEPVDFTYLEVNHEFGVVTGLKNVVGKTATEIFPGIKKLHPELFVIYGRVAQGGKPEKFEIDFKPLSLWLSISVYSPGKGYFIAVFENITERKENEKKLKESEHHLSLTVQNIPVGMIEWDKDFQVTNWNPAAEKIFGHTKSEAMGKHANFIIPEEVRPHVDEIWKQLLAGSINQSTNENITKDGRRITCDWHNSPLTLSDGKVFGVVSMMLDITEQKKAEESLIAQNQELEKFKELTVGRELKMINLKKEIERLKSEKGVSK